MNTVKTKNTAMVTISSGYFIDAIREQVQNCKSKEAYDLCAKLARHISKILGYDDENITEIKVSPNTFDITYVYNGRDVNLTIINVEKGKWRASFETIVSTTAIDLESMGGEVIALLNDFYYGASNNVKESGKMNIQKFPCTLIDGHIIYATKMLIRNANSEMGLAMVARLVKTISKILGFDDADIVRAKLTPISIEIDYVEIFEDVGVNSKGVRLIINSVSKRSWKAAMETHVSKALIDIGSDSGEVVSILNSFYYAPVPHPIITSKHPESWLDDEGCIPVNHICPFRIVCPSAKSGACHHLGFNHNKQFSCASARGYDITKDKK